MNAEAQSDQLMKLIRKVVSENPEVLAASIELAKCYGDEGIVVVPGIDAEISIVRVDETPLEAFPRVAFTKKDEQFLKALRITE